MEAVSRYLIRNTDNILFEYGASVLIGRPIGEGLSHIVFNMRSPTPVFLIQYIAKSFGEGNTWNV